MALSSSYDKAMLVDAQSRDDGLRAHRACAMENTRSSKSLRERRTAAGHRSGVIAEILEVMCSRPRGAQA